MMRAADYRIQIEPLAPEDGGGFVAWVPDLPRCVSDGETVAEAAANVQRAIEEWIEESRRLGRRIPEPSLVAASG
jgi:antitoxin HicB